MAWQPYVDSNLLGTGKLVEAAILSLNDTGVWAISQDYQTKFTAKEQADIRTVATKLSVVDNSAEEPARDEALSGMRAGGIHVRGTKFMFTRNDYRSIHGTKKTADGRVIGVIIVRTVRTIIVAEYAPPHQAGEATPIVENVADYLISTGN